MRLTDQYERKLTDLRDKSKERTKIIRAQKEIIRRRDARIEKDKQIIKELRRTTTEYKKKIVKLEKRLEQGSPMSSTPVKHHTYDAELIQLCLRLRSASGCSYRGCVNVLKVLVLTLGLNLKIPSIGSIRNWEIKYGYHNVNRTCNGKSCWALILDESVSIGSEKLLLLIGVNLDGYDFDRPLSHSDVRILDVRLAKSWKAEDIHTVIESVRDRGYKLSYACSDSGNNLCKSLKLSDLRRVSDCGHKFGYWLKKNYQHDVHFLKFRELSNAMKKSLILSKHAEIVPPRLRAKGRYLNISAIAKWADTLVELAKKYKRRKKPPSFFDKISWLLDYSTFIRRINHEQNLINEVNKVLKHEGLSHDSAKKCRELTAQSKACISLKEHIKAYLSEYLDLLGGEQKLICSSDVIESIFGLYKHRNSANPCSSITQSCLTIASYGEKAETEQVKKAMEAVSIVDLQNWKREHLSETVAQRRRKVFQKTA